MGEVLIEPAVHADDVAEALALVWNAFVERTPTTRGISYKETLWYADPAYSPDNIIVARGADRKIIAVVRLVPRVIMRSGQPYSIAGISSVCVADHARGTGVASAIMTMALQIARKRGYDLAFLFARKALDGYYLKFGFCGLSAYSRLLVEPPAAAAHGVPVSMEPARWLDVSSYARAHDYSYEACFGRVRRDAAYWAFLREKVQLLPDVAIFDILVQDRWCGYAIAGEGMVHELATAPDFPADAIGGLLDALATPRNSRRVELAVAPQHQIVALLADFDTVSTSRQCVYGGHMGVVLNSKAVLEKFSARVARTLATLGTGPMRRDFGGVRMDWSEGQCRAELTADKLSHADTCTLLGATGNSLAGVEVDSALPLNIALCDQF